MRVVAENPKKWQVAHVTHPDGRFEIRTDIVGTRGQDRYLHELRDQGLAVTVGPNVIVEATLRVAKDRLVDVDTGIEYAARDWSLIDIVAALADGRLRGGDGTVRGRFTFKNSGGCICISAAPGKGRAAPVAEEAPAGVPDLSALVATLGPA